MIETPKKEVTELFEVASDDQSLLLAEYRLCLPDGFLEVYECVDDLFLKEIS